MVNDCPVPGPVGLDNWPAGLEPPQGLEIGEMIL